MKKETIFGILVLGLIAVSIILALNVKTQTTTERNKLTATGNSELTVVPDKAEIYITIETLKDTATASKNENAKITDNVIKALKEKGVANDDISTYRFNLFRKESWNDVTRKMEFEGYQLTHVLKVVTEELNSVGELIDFSVNAGANGVERVSFGLTKEKEKDARDQALAKASSLAGEKAEAMAASLGLRLESIISVSESGFYYAPYDYYPRAGAAVKEMAVETTIQPENVEISATINVVYEIK